MRKPTDHLDFLRALEREPYRYDFFQTLRRIECLFADKPRLGQALRPVDEPLRLAQDVSMAFAPATIAAFLPGQDGRPPRLTQRFFGLLGPNGPLPLHLTDHIRERLLHHGDTTAARFFDLFHHRLLALFYRAWAQAQPTVSLDRPGADRFSFLVGALIGIGSPRLRNRDAAGDFAKLFHAGLLARQVRNADGLQALLSSFFRLPLRVEQFAGHWMTLPAGDRTRLGSGTAGARLGTGAVLGARVWDRQHKFRLRVGPLTLAQYEGFLPGGMALPQLVALVRQYLCFELDWDVQLVLRRAEVPRTRLGQFGRLGWTIWLGRARGEHARSDPDDLTLDAESVLARHVCAAAA
jgi:type VI secretion system protein ImpH